MNRHFLPAAGLLAASFLAGCSSAPEAIVSVTNPLPSERSGEMVEIPLSQLAQVRPGTGETYVVTDEAGIEVPSQVTHDSLLVFPVSVDGNATADYWIKAGTPDSVPVTACGRVYPERLDDLAWENDKAAYRAYGPAFQAKDQKGYGYDVFTKSVPTPVVEHRYAMETDQKAWAQINAWQREGQKAKADSLIDAISYHTDHGNGMDCYNVGPTLGGGTAALMADSALVYPYCYKTCEVLDNGPLRFTARLTFHPLTVKADTGVVETRVITLDKGSYLNRTEITYTNLSSDTPLAVGIVIHPQHRDGFSLDAEKGYIAYADSTDNAANGNGVIYIGAVGGKPFEKTGVQWFGSAELPQRAGALGHVLGFSTYRPGTTYVYYWGSSWSKSDMPGMEAWEACLKDYAQRLRHPLQISIRQ